MQEMKKTEMKGLVSIELDFKVDLDTQAKKYQTLMHSQFYTFANGRGPNISLNILVNS